jgi:enoyl-CoA hydratase
MNNVKKMDFKFLDVEETDHNSVTIVIRREEKRNALCRDLLLELKRVFSSLAENKTVRSVSLTGAGKAFIGGADLGEMALFDSLDYYEYGRLFASLNDAMQNLSVPIIVAVNGFALGGGNVLALSGDIIIASENAKFSLPEINVGIFGGAGVMPRYITKFLASEMILIGEMYDAQRGYELGLVNKITRPEELMGTALAYAQKINNKSALAISLAKKVIADSSSVSALEASEKQLLYLSLMYSSEDQKEGMNAFLEKRKPVYKGV